MARGNQRDKAREANQKKLAATVRIPSLPSLHPHLQEPVLTAPSCRPQKKGNTLSGSELAKAKEVAAQKMREKQLAGMRRPVPN